MQKLRFSTFLVLFFLPLAVFASEFREGTDYKLLKQPLPVTAPAGKIEVDTVFWYGCPHCYDLARLQKNWEKGLGSDVELVDVPVIFGKPWQAHAQLFYTLEELKILDKAHFPVFDAVQKQGQRLDNKRDISEFLHRHFRVKADDFERIHSSFGVRYQVQKASALARGAQLAGVPAIIVNGQYIVDPAMAGGLENMLKVTDFLIQKVRHEKAEKQAAEKKDKPAG